MSKLNEMLAQPPLAIGAAVRYQRFIPALTQPSTSTYAALSNVLYPTTSATFTVQWVYRAALLPALLCLLLALWWTVRSRSGQIRLPNGDAASHSDREAEEEGCAGPDKIQGEMAAQHNERLMGQVLGLQDYHKILKQRRIFLACLVLLVILIDLGENGLRFLRLSETLSPSGEVSLSDAFQWAVVLSLAVLPLGDEITLARWASIFTLSTIALLLKVTHLSLYLQLADETTTSPQTAPSVQALSICIATLAWLVAGSTPLGPKRIYQRCDPRGSDEEKEELLRPVYPADDGGEASLFSRILFAHARPIASAALRKGSLGTEDLPGASVSWRAEKIAREMSGVYLKESASLREAQQEALATGKVPALSPWPLVRAVFKANVLRIARGHFLSICCSLMRFAPILCINRFLATLEVHSAESPDIYERIKTAAPWALALFFSAAALAIVKEYCNYWMNVCVYLPLQGQLCTLLVGKALRKKDTIMVSNRQQSETPEDGDEAATKEKDGDKEEDEESRCQVLTLLSTDVERIASVGWQTVSLATTPLELLVGLYFLWKLLGVSALCGIVASIIAAPLTYYLGTVSAQLEDRIQSARDKRVGVISEMLQSIKMIKFNAWESRAREKVEQVRQEELSGIAAEFAIGLLMYVVTSFSLALMGIAALGHYTLVRGEALTPSIAFSALAILEGLQYTTSAIPDEIVTMLQAAVSFLRTARYLQSEEIKPPSGQESSLNGQTPSTVALSGATVTWPVDEIVEVKAGTDPSDGAGKGSFTLRNLNVTFTVGQLNLVVGRLGSGKSLLLKALLGEAQVLSGLVLSPRSSPTALAEDRLRLVQPFQSSTWQDASRVAYVPQTTYLQSGTIRANVLFGLPLWEKRYQETLDACGLRPDVTAFEDGDLTLVGENGVTLSGGQKARVSLARAIYSRASTLLLDDCLSAVDAETAAHISAKLFKGPLCSGRTVILVSHQVQLIAPAAAKVVVVDEGSVAFDGDSQTFLASKWSDVAQEVASKEENSEEQTVEALLSDEKKPSAGQSSSSGSTTQALPSDTSATKVASGTPAVASDPPEDGDTALKVEPKTMQEEARSFGSIPMHIYWSWLRAGSSAVFWLFVASLFVLSSWSAVFTNVWLKWWMQQSAAIEAGHAAHSTAWWFGWYSVISVGSILLIAVRKALVYYGTIKSSRALFRQMTNAVLRAPLGFHNACPQGRLLNRFGSDFQTVDVSVPYQAAWFLPSVLAIFLNLGAAVLSGGASSLLPVVLVVPAYLWYGRMFLTATRDARRLSMLAYSKVMSSVAEMTTATPVIRAFGASEYLRRAFFDVYDDWLMAKLPAATISHYVSLRLELLGAVLTFLVSALIVLDPGSAWRHTFNAATAGFLLTTIHNVQEAMERTLYSYAALERSLVSVERVIEYTRLPSEAAEIVEPRPHASWPSKGRIDFVNVAARYAADLPLVLKNISFSLPAASKIAIVGSTGSGKSTLVQSLFRLIEADAGEILIDGINIGKIGLQDLRSKLQIVPQDPIILAGSLRSAVDVLGTCKDDEVLAALKAVALIRDDSGQSSAVPPIASATSSYSTEFSNLNYPISEGGSNLSAGEKQLICLARCILSQSKIIVLDEATSSTDPETEAIVSQSVHRVFTQSTVIAIAHRLRSIIDFDKVLVIEEGEVAEFDSPGALLSKGEESKFYRLCQATGDAEFAYLKDRASRTGR